MPKYDTGFDLLSKNLEKVLSANAEGQKARTDFQNSLLLAKMKANYEQQIKQGEMKDKFGYDLAVKQAETPYLKWAKEQYEKEQGGGGNPGGRRMVPGASGFTTEKVTLKDMAEKIYQKPPETWTPQEKNVVAQYISFAKATKGGNAPLFSNDNMAVEPVAQPDGQPTTTMRVKDIGSGQTGTINVSEFDPAKFEKI